MFKNFISNDKKISIDIINFLLELNFSSLLEESMSREESLNNFSSMFTFYSATWEEYKTSASDNIYYLPDIIKWYILHNLTQCGKTGFDMLIEELELEHVNLMKILLPPSAIYLMRIGKFKDIIDILNTYKITKKDKLMLANSCIAQIIWDQAKDLTSKYIMK